MKMHVCHRPGPGGLPLALRLSEGLGRTSGSRKRTLYSTHDVWLLAGAENHLLVDGGLLRDPEPKNCICLGHDGQSASACIFGASESPLIELAVVPNIFGRPQRQFDY